MKEKLQAYKKYIEYGSFIVVVVTLVLGIWMIFQNGGRVIETTLSVMGGFLDVISPIIYAFALAYILYRPVAWIEKKFRGLVHTQKEQHQNEKVGLGIRLLSILVVFVIVGAALVGLGYALVPPIIENVQELVVNNAEINKMLGQLADKLPIDLNNLGQELIRLIQSKDMMQIVLVYIEEVLGGVGSIIIDTVAALILTFYFLKDRERLIVAVDRFGTVIFSKKVKEYVKIILHDIDDILGGFIVGTLLAGIVVGIISTSLMLLIQHPFAVLIGTVAGIMNMVPYVGPLVGAILALVLGLLDSVSLGVTGCLLLLLYQQVDGNFIEPKIVGDKIGLPPVWILIVVIIGGSYFGGIGMVLSAPVAALIKVYIDRVYTYKTKKDKSENEINSI